MFKNFRNIDTALRHIRLFSLVLIVANLLAFFFYTYRFDRQLEKAQDKVLILLNGKVVEAMVSDRKTNLPVELRDHVATFHQYFFSLEPDEKVIASNISRALNLADQSVKKEYDNLREKGFYSSIISGNVSQSIKVDSVSVNVDKLPYYFKCYATLSIIRSTSVVTRNLVTEGSLRELEKSDNNPQGFLIERWKILENKDLTVETR